jgi:transposase
VELSKYILCKFQGYSYKNLKSTPIEKNKPKYKEIRRMYAELMLPLLADERTARTVIYVDEMACSLSSFLKRKGSEFKRVDSRETEEYVSVLIAARNEEVVYYEVREGFPSRRDFLRALGCIRRKMNQLLKYEAGGEQWPLVVVCDLNRIHREVEGDGDSIREALSALNMHQYFLPPFSFQLNPLETLFLNIKTRVGKREIHSIHDLHAQILHYMRELQAENVDVHFKEIPDWLHKSLREENF